MSLRFCVKVACLFLFVHCAAHNIIFVHVGKTIPDYCATALNQASLTNPSANIYFLIKSSQFKKFKKQHNFPGNVELVNIYNAPQTDVHLLLSKKRRRENWYPYSLRYLALERFFHLYDFVKEKRLSDVFHLENDNLLYVNLEKYLPAFHKNYPEVAATQDSHGRIIAGLIYFNHPDAIRFLTKHLIEKSRIDTFEMQTLAQIKNDTEDRLIRNLPIVSKSYITKGLLKGDIGEPKEKYAAFIEDLPLIFDACALGQYVGGTDSKDARPGFINETAVIDPSRIQIEWREEEERRVPYYLFEAEAYPIANLHIHSKNLNEYRSSN